jgi:trk system potassium uptake protein TrkH
MIIGGMMDSTSGGLKLFRVYIIIRVIKSRISLFFKPKGTTFHIEVRKGMSKKLIDNESLREVISIVFIYFLVYFIGVFVMLAYGYNLEESLFEYASALSAVGLSVGTTTPEAPNGIIWVKTIGMYLGRLEFFAIFYAIIKLYKDLKQGLLTKLNKK